MTRTLACISFTERGASLAQRLQASLQAEGAWRVEVARCFGDAHVSLAAWTEQAFSQADALLFVGAAGIAVRAIAPHVCSKLSDPAVLVADEGGSYVIPLLSGHIGGANDLARQVSDVLGAQSVLTTATDVRGLWAVDDWAARQGLVILNPQAIKEVSSRLLSGREVLLYSDVPLQGCMPSGVALTDDVSRAHVVISAYAKDSTPDQLILVPRIVTLGIGCKRGTSEEAIQEALSEALASLGHKAPRLEAITSVTTIDLKQDEPGLVAFCEHHAWPMNTYSAEELQQVNGSFTPSAFVQSVTGVDNVCERAALAEGGTLLLPKHARSGVTIAIALAHPEPLAFAEAPTKSRHAKAHCLSVVGLGPGKPQAMTQEARACLESADVVVGYRGYVEEVRRLFPEKDIRSTGMRHEIERCQMALELAESGRHVAMVCSGDAGVFGMASPILELAPNYPQARVEVIPGVSAAQSAGAVLGAPLGHDFATISLSDALTSWDVIEHRLAAAAECDLCLALYNPRSHTRPDHLRRAVDIVLAAGKSGYTACGWVRNAGRQEESHGTCTLAELRDLDADMFTTVFIGNAHTTLIAGRMVTPRGYEEAGA